METPPIPPSKSPTHRFFSISLWVDLKEGTIRKKIVFVLKEYFDTNRITLISFSLELVGEKTEKGRKTQWALLKKLVPLGS